MERTLSSDRGRIVSWLRGRAGHRLVLFLILSLGLAARLYLLDSKAIFWDESLSYYVANHDLPSILRGDLDPGQPPLYYLILHAWLGLGSSPFVLRGLSVAFGLCSVLLTYQVGRILFDAAIGALAAFLFAIAPFQVTYAQYARTHEPALTFGLLSVLFFLQALRQDRRVYWVGWVIASLLAVYTQYLTFFVVLVEDVYVLFLYTRREERWPIKRWAWSHAGMLVGYLPWLPTLWLSFIGSQYYVPQSPGRLSLLAALPGTLYTFTLGKLQPSLTTLPLILLAVVAFGLAFLLGLVPHRDRSRRHAQLFLSLWLLLPLITVVALSFFKPVYSLSETRYLLFITPAYCLLVAVGVARIRARIPRTALILLLALAAILGLGLYYRHDDYYGLKAGAGYIQQEYQPGDAILYQDAAGWSFWYYLSTGLPDYDKASPMQDQDLAALIRQGRTRRVWSVSYSTTTAAEMAGQLLGEVNAPSSETTPSDAPSRFGSSGARLARVSTVTYPGRVTVQVSLYEVLAQP